MNPITIIRERIAESKAIEANVAPPKAFEHPSYAEWLKHCRTTLPMWRSIAEQLLEALEKADSRLHLICGSYMALDHGEPEDHFYEALNKMGADMNAVRSALAAITQQLAGVGAS